MDCSPPGSSTHGIFQARILEWVAISFSIVDYGKSLQSCPTLCDPMDCSPPGSSIHGILQARILEWVAISSSRGSSQPRVELGSPALCADSLLSQPQFNYLNISTQEKYQNVFQWQIKSNAKFSTLEEHILYRK